MAEQTKVEAVFEAFGVRVRLESDEPELLELGKDVARTALVGRPVFIENKTESVDHTFGIYRGPGGGLLYTNEGEPSGEMAREIGFRRSLDTMIRIHVAEKSRNWIFIHAGVVGWRGHAIILPASSYNGKTTLVGELIRLGADYYSDEYAVVGPNGMVHPYERDLSVRLPDSGIPVPIPPAEFGAETGKVPLPVGMVALTKFEEIGVFRPESVSMGIGIMETLPRVISIRRNTDFSLKVLNTAFRRAIIIKSLRGEAKDAARSILSYFDDKLNLAN